MDYIAGRQVAALVYARRKHLINVFLWPKEEGPMRGAAETTRQGYHMLHFTEHDYSYWVVSDLGSSELEQFSRLLQKSE
jgi:anti-sigma factor RsiW